ncbi:hypothetical protein Ae201684P_013611 [Aphanomyces euteiches]|uniref:UDENN domain-containing protein n=1 Tax=Aphanomyces euteiches TaxID=100861 RepID=A0A6G0WFW9_9STRA|nr:hypothetical protein Ae201684_016171 [Aphanomyces euteiches]KAH9052109.1 hypothetical protein Ae201684P_013611 [Aphanomyces euteiches]KAH9155425.1 hypothetical protein AeRB84_002593 [Aphanomyces euteiches]
MRKADVVVVVDGLVGSAHDRILYTYLNQQGQEAIYSILADIHKYTKLDTRSKRQAQAELIVQTYFKQPDAMLLDHLNVKDLLILQPLIDAVDKKTCSLDMWASLDERLKRSLDWTTFFKLDMFGDFCNMIRELHPMTLVDVLGECNASRIRFLELWMREFNPAGVGNLLFWIDVQTSFLPLVMHSSPTVFSVARFEEIQVTVRRIFNTYLADNNTTHQTAVSVLDDTKKDVLTRILLYQGEPFSPARYASLFKTAQDQVWKWLQQKIFPNYQNSMLYIQWMVEVELLEVEPYLCKAYAAYHGHHASNRPKGTLLFPLPPPRAMPSIPTALPDTKLVPSSFTLAFPSTESPIFDRVLIFSIKSDASAASLALDHLRVRFSLDAYWGVDTAVPDIQPFCLLRPPLFQKSSRTAGNPTPRIHLFAFVRDSTRFYGLCVTQWRAHDDDDTVFLPVYTSFLATESLCPWRTQLQTAAIKTHQLAHMEWSPSIWADALADTHVDLPLLSPSFLAFADGISHCDVEPIFRSINLENIVAILASLLMEHRVILVSTMRSRLSEAADALVDLLKPFHWMHTFLPFCPPTMATKQLAEQPCFIGIEGTIEIKRSDASTHRIRNSLCNLSKVHPVVKDGTFNYPAELIHHPRAVLVDLDFDEVYLPLKHEPPELPQTAVRTLELAWRRVLNPRHAHADHFLFSPPPKSIETPVFVSSIERTTDGLKACMLEFLDTLFGRTTDFFRTFPNNIHLGRNKPAIAIVGCENFGVFDIDGFLEAHIELGCRDFFRQVFASEAFMDFLARQRRRFHLADIDENLE